MMIRSNRPALLILRYKREPNWSSIVFVVHFKFFGKRDSGGGGRVAIVVVGDKVLLVENSGVVEGTGIGPSGLFNRSDNGYIQF